MVRGNDMNNFELILFDLDGTLTDSQAGIVNSIHYAFNRLGLPSKERHELASFIGPPLLDSFMNRCGLDERLAREAIGLYREYYSRQGIYECTVYAGLPEMLHLLNRRRKKLIVATSKPTYFAVKLLAYLKLDKHFSLIMGSNLDGTRVDKTEVIACALQAAGNGAETRPAAMVGDRKYDILGAKANGICSVAVTYGFGTREELTAAGPDFIASTVQDLTAVLSSNRS